MAAQDRQLKNLVPITTFLWHRPCLSAGRTAITQSLRTG
ncbi:hypothetical protein [Mycobacterium leprae]|nr:hypothetical protein [Mycobacterium leprae]